MVAEADRVAALKRHLRDVLLEARPANGASPELRLRVLSVADARPRSRFAGFAVRVGWAAGSIAAGAAAILVLWFLGTRGVVPIEVPGRGALATPAAFDPTRTGLGIMPTVLPTLQWVPAIIAISAVIVAAWLVVRYRSRRSASGLIGVGLALAVALGAVGISQHPGFVWGSGAYAALIGLGVEQEPAPASGGVTTFYETAEPGGPIGVLVTLTNPGPLPIRLEGLVQPTPVSDFAPRWTALWLVSDPNAIGYPDNLRPFQPIEVAPEGTVDLYLIGRAGSCAIGPTFKVPSRDVGYVSNDRDIELAYSVFGLDRGGLFSLPFGIAEPVLNNCSG
jgi:hypothetical protein